MRRLLFISVCVVIVTSCNTNYENEKDKKIEELEDKIRELENKIETNESQESLTNQHNDKTSDLNQYEQQSSLIKYVFAQANMTITTESPDEELNKKIGGDANFYKFEGKDYIKVTNVLTIENYNEDVKYRLIDALNRKLKAKFTYFMVRTSTSVKVTDVKVNVYASYAQASIARDTIANSSEFIIEKYDF